MAPMRAVLAPAALVLLLAWVVGVALAWRGAVNWSLLGVAAALLAVRSAA
jgi:hypothetical protein